jgi:hypothetical protein
VWTLADAPVRLTVSITAPLAHPECPHCHDGANRLTLSELTFQRLAPLELHVVYACVRRNAGDPPSTCRTAPLNTHTRLFVSGSSLVAQTFPVALRDFHVTPRDPITISLDGDFRIRGGPLTPARLGAFHQQVCSLARQAGGDALPLNEVVVGFAPGPAIGIFGLSDDHCLVVSVDPSDMDRTAETMAEELGHALGRPHAGCNVHPPGEDEPCDPTLQVFPCAHGGICDVGFNTYGLRAIDPGDLRGTQAHAHDFMSYGGGVQWISPYTYRKLFDTLRALWAAQGE